METFPAATVPSTRVNALIAHPTEFLTLAVSYWKAIMSVRLSVADFGFNGSLLRLAGF